MRILHRQHHQRDQIRKKRRKKNIEKEAKFYETDKNNKNRTKSEQNHFPFLFRVHRRFVFAFFGYFQKSTGKKTLN